MEDSEGGPAAQATPQEAQKEVQQVDEGNAMEEDRPPHMEWTYKVGSGSVLVAQRKQRMLRGGPMPRAAPCRDRHIALCWMQRARVDT